MDQEQPSLSQRKVKFTPKAPPRRKPRPTVPKSEVNTNNDEDDAAQAKKLMTKFNENLTRKMPKVDKKSSVQVAFGPGATRSTSIKKYGVPSSENAGSSSRSGINDSANEDEAIIYNPDGMDALPLKIKRDYKEPWDYSRTYYPTTLPLRRPYAGDPEILNETEFGEAARRMEYNEKTINPALDLGLLEEYDKERMIFFQLPPKLPLVKRSASVKEKEKAEGSTPSQGKSASKKEIGLEGSSGGYLGKMLVYRSGVVKLKLGDILYDVSPGSDCLFPQNIVAIDTKAKHCCTIGELRKRAVVTPDVDSLLDSVIDLS